MKLVQLFEQIAYKPNKISENGKKFIKCKEKFLPTFTEDTKEKTSQGLGIIGYGNTVKKSEYAKKKITPNEADKLLTNFLVKNVYPVINNYIKVNLTQNQFDAICSLIYNVGPTAFINSKTLKAINGSKGVNLTDEWTGFNKSSGKVLGGLTKRRQEEINMFNNKPTSFSGCVNYV